MGLAGHAREIRMKSWKTRSLAALMLACAGAMGALPGEPVTAAFASEIRYLVNNLPVTNYDIQRRAAFLRLQRQGGNLNQKASDEMVEQALKYVEMQRLGVKVPDKAVDENFAGFAKQNKLSTAQLSQILGQAGVTTRHFKDFIRVQLGWNALLGARFRSEGRISEQDAVRRMLKQGGQKPSATEYLLQQVIFVIPAAERKAKMGVRKKEAELMRQRYNGCGSARDLAKGLIDVTVRDLGRVLEPELPPDWAPLIKTIKAGQATKLRETERGVEFIAICSAKEVSDDRVAQMIFTNEGDLEGKAKELSDKYIAELREKARIQKR